MAHITDGSVHYARRVNLGNYEHKEFSADISWSADDADVPEDVEAIMGIVATHAVDMVHGRLGIERTALEQVPVEAPAPAEPAAPITFKQAAALPPVDLGMVAEIVPPKKRSPALEEAIKEREAALARLTAAASSGEVIDDPLALDASEPVSNTEAEMSHDELYPAINRLMLHKPATMIAGYREILGEFGATQMAQVPADRRREFLAKVTTFAEGGETL